jgi:hypothetical protein
MWTQIKRMGNSPAFKPLSRRLGKKPVITAVNSLAMDGGTGFVVDCDLAIVADTAYFGLPEVKRRLAPIGALYHDSSVRLDCKERRNLL